LELEVGDVVNLGQPLSKPVLLFIEGTPRFSGQVVRCKDRSGIMLEGRPSELEMHLLSC
jgi:flagellar motor switch protein FliM